MEPPTWPLVVALALLLGVAYRLALAHAAVAGVSRSRIRALGEQGNRRAAVLAVLLGQRDVLHGALRIAFDATLVVAAAALWLLSQRGSLPLWAFAALAALLVPLVAELVPRVVASRRSETTALRHARWIGLWYRLLGAPARWVLREPVRDEPDEEAAEESIRELVDSASLGVERRKRIAEILEFPDKCAGEVMIPRIDIVGVPATATLAEAAAVITSSGHSRVPVLGESRDQVVGMLHSNDVISAMPGSATAAEIAREATFVPEEIRLDLLLRELRARQSSIAIVVDEYGGTAGLVTVEDVIEEIVGDIADETDREEAPELRPRGEGGWIVAARMELEELAEQLDLDLPVDESVQTVGGLAMSLAEDLPRVGEVTVWEGGSRRLLTLTLSADGPRLVELAVLAQEVDPTAPHRAIEGGEPLDGSVCLAELATQLYDELPPETTARLSDLFAFWPAGSRAGRSVIWRSHQLEVLDEGDDGALRISVRPEAEQRRG